MPIYPHKDKKRTETSKISIWQMDVVDLFSASKRQKLSITDLSLFCRKLSFLLESGIALKSAMPMMKEQSSRPVHADAVSYVHKKVMQGESFSRALKSSNAFPAFTYGYVAIGEQTGQLPKVCKKLAEFYEKKLKFNSEFTNTLIYPVLVTIVMTCVIVFAIIAVLPGYAQLFTAYGMSLPFATALLINISNFIIENAVILLMIAAAGIAAMSIFLRTNTGKKYSTNIKLKIPIIRQGINLQIVQALSLILSAGISISQAVPLCAETVDNNKIAADLKQLSAELDTGEPFWKSLNRIGYIEKTLVEMAKVGEETGRLSEIIENFSNNFESKYDYKIKHIGKIIEPIIAIVMGILLLAIMLAVILPTFELSVLF